MEQKECDNAEYENTNLDLNLGFNNPSHGNFPLTFQQRTVRLDPLPLAYGVKVKVITWK